MAKGARLHVSITMPIDLLLAQEIGDGSQEILPKLTALSPPGRSKLSLPPAQLVAVLGPTQHTVPASAEPGQPAHA